MKIGLGAAILPGCSPGLSFCFYLMAYGVSSHFGVLIDLLLDFGLIWLNIMAAEPIDKPQLQLMHWLRSSVA